MIKGPGKGGGGVRTLLFLSLLHSAVVHHEHLLESHQSRGLKELLRALGDARGGWATGLGKGLSFLRLVRSTQESEGHLVTEHAW